MLNDIASVHGNADALGRAPPATDILNLRFRPVNVTFFGPDQFARPDDRLTDLKRYMLHYLEGGAPKSSPAPPGRHRGSETPPAGRTVFRPPVAAVQYTPEHARIQRKLFTELASEFPAARIVCEQDFVDIGVHTDTDLVLFEIKSDLDPRAVIRQALGQLLEYAFHPRHQHKVPVRLLVIVGRSQLTAADQDYLKRLQTKFSLPLEYRVVSSYAAISG